MRNRLLVSLLGPASAKRVNAIPDEVTLTDLLAMDRDGLVRLGFTIAQAKLILACADILRDRIGSEIRDSDPVRDPGAAAKYLTAKYLSPVQEVMGALFLDSRHRVISEQEFFRGTIARASVEPRPILRHAILVSAVSVIVFHTHPSGDPAPSAEDLAFTRRLSDAGGQVGVRLVDHLILGSGRHVSLRGAW